MIQAAKLTEIPGTARTYSAQIIHLRILASSTGEEDAGAATLPSASERSRSRAGAGRWRPVAVPDDEVYRCANVEGSPRSFTLSRPA